MTPSALRLLLLTESRLQIATGPASAEWVELMLNTAYEKQHRPAAPAKARISAHKDTGIYIGCPDVDAAYRHLLALGLQLTEPKVAPYGMKQLISLIPTATHYVFSGKLRRNHVPTPRTRERVGLNS